MASQFRSGTALALFVVLSQAACSLVAVSGPPENHASLDYFSCTANSVAPVLDILGGAAYVGVVTLASALGEEGSSGSTLAVGLSGGGLAVVSAFTGFSRIERCRGALGDLDDRAGAPNPLAPDSASVSVPSWRSPELAAPGLQRPTGSQP